MSADHDGWLSEGLEEEPVADVAIGLSGVLQDPTETVIEAMRGIPLVLDRPQRDAGEPARRQPTTCCLQEPSASAIPLMPREDVEPHDVTNGGRIVVCVFGRSELAEPDDLGGAGGQHEDL